jgi:hypothetical protein
MFLKLETFGAVYTLSIRYEQYLKCNEIVIKRCEYLLGLCAMKSVGALAIVVGNCGLELK